MVKNYAALYIYLITGYISLCFTIVTAQEVRIFKLADFDLKGTVKSCRVITSYGKEEFEFNKDGFLTKSVTRFNDTDYDLTIYRFNSRKLEEKRIEIYRDGVFDPTISYANFYTFDSTALKKTTEKIVSYTKEFLGQNEYFYDSIGRLSRIKHINKEGIDETKVKYELFKGETTVNYVLNDNVIKSVRTSIKKDVATGKDQKVILTKEFLNGDPNKALEQIYDAKDRLISEIRFVPTGENKKFIPQDYSTYSYNEFGSLAEMRIKTPKKEELKKYTYQYDGETGNWVKQIISPDNSYTTRRIQYF